MDTLLNPDSGLIIWTIVSFLVLVGLMKAFAWGPLLGAIEAREAHMREQTESAEKARKEAERIQKEVEERLANAESEVKGLLAQAGRDAEVLRGKLRKDAEDEAKGMVDKTRKQLEEDKKRLVGEMRKEVASLSVLAAERLVRKSVDSGVKKDVLDRFFVEMDKKGTN